MCIKNVVRFFKLFFTKILGIFLIIIGVIGLFLPFLQGVLFIVTGLVLLGNKSAKDKIIKFKKWVKKLRHR